MKRKIIFDCDNTMGLLNCDVDDGLALLCILANKEVELLAITTSFGNNKTEIVYKNTKAMITDLNLDIPIYLGALEPMDYDNEASKFIAKMVEIYRNEIEILAAGSLTNIAGAYSYNKNFYKELKSITLMGGITEDLIFEKKKMNELNFSIDYKSSYQILTKAHDINIMTGNACLSLIFELKEYRQKLLSSKNKVNIRTKDDKEFFETLGEYILYKTSHWFDYNEEVYGIKGFYNWDALAALYFLYPFLFKDNIARYNLNESDLKTGYLRISTDDKGIKLNLPSVDKAKEIKDRFYKSIL